MTAERRAMQIVNTILAQVQDDFIPADSKTDFADRIEKFV